MRDTANLTPRMHVHIRAFDDTPSHQFLVEEVLRVLSPDSSGSSQGTAYTLSLVVITNKITIIRAKRGYRPGRKRYVDTD